jgi:hypothetical protein
MARRADPERIHQARRIAVRNGLSRHVGRVGSPGAVVASVGLIISTAVCRGG